MKRIQEKVKDLIEVRSHKSLRDFISDPAKTLSIYHFTDITSDLMAKCLDKIAAVQNGRGTAAALAGYRGVGKSHFLATLGAIVSHPELRSR
jgi:DNA replication protein DnaC